MKPSTHLKKRFCKDCGISVQVFTEPYFTERVELLGKIDEWHELLDVINHRFNGNEEEFFAAYNELKDNIIKYIKASDAFKALNSDDMNKYAVQTDIKKSEVFKEHNIGKNFISIDMIKANFSSLIHYSKNNDGIKHDFFENYSWNEFMEIFTNIPHFINSKYIRQVVFGNCNPKRQVTYEKYVMSDVLKYITKECSTMCEKDIITDNVYCFLNDEIIIDCTEMTDVEVDSIKRAVAFYSQECIPLRFEHYKLGRVRGTSAYIKMLGGHDYELKCASPAETLFIARYMNSQPISENDRVFIADDNRLAKYLEVPEISLDFETKNK